MVTAGSGAYDGSNRTWAPYPVSHHHIYSSSKKGLTSFKNVFLFTKTGIPLLESTHHQYQFRQFFFTIKLLHLSKAIRRIFIRKLDIKW